MQSQKTFRRHAGLVDRMASTLGLDLEETALRGELPVDEIADAVLRCTACTDPGGCEHWLDTQGQGDADRPPAYCRNADLFTGLTRG
ncbi:MAG: DUF6455 family protein [Paracoccaceae bacterium]